MTQLMKAEPAGEIVQVNPMSILQLAIEKGASIDQLERLMAMQERFEANEAKKAFNVAFTEFKGETIRIVRDKENTQYSKGDKKAMYTSLENMVATVTPFLSKHGLSHSWDVDQAKGIRVSCILTHTLGHSTSVSMEGPADESGAKNKLQQIKSTLTYLKVSTFESVCGLASAFGSTNDDGNGAGSKGMDLDEFERLCGLIEGAGSPESLKTIYLAACADAKGLGDQGAINKFAEIKNARWKELHGGR